jgi:hypothetical protein
VPDVEPIWCSLFAKALDGKDVKDLLLNVGSGGGAAAAPAAGGAAPAGDAAAEAPKEEEKEEGKLISMLTLLRSDLVGIVLTWLCCREGGVGRGHGLWSVRLSDSQHRACSEKNGGDSGLKHVAFCDGASSSCGSFLSMLAAVAAVIRSKNIPVSSSSLILPVEARRSTRMIRLLAQPF